jgi:predicted nuclease with TOPRIM domain
MRRAFAIKAVAAAVVALAWWQLGAPWNVVVTALVVTATVALFVWAIASRAAAGADGLSARRPRHRVHLR